MLLTLALSIIATQIFTPLFVNFEQQTQLKQALSSSGPGVVLSGPVKVNEYNLGPQLTSSASVVIDQASRQVLWSSNLHQRRPIASITKLMTALVFLDQTPDLGANFTLSQDDVAGDGVRYLERGDTVLLKDLFSTALIASDNNAAQSLIRASGLKEDQFIDKMNLKAHNLGLYNTRFVEPTGLYFANISSAQDAALLLEAALSNPLIADTLAMSNYQFQTAKGDVRLISSTNKLLNSYLDIIGGKTGFNNEAQFNFTAAVKGDQDQVLLIVTLGSGSEEDRFQDVKAMADWTFRNYIWP